MARTLACLVASMTVGAVVLDWFQPSPPLHHLPGRQLIAELRGAIQQPARGDTVDQPWHAIRVDPQQGDPDGRKAPSHIVLSHDGRLTLTESWRTQSPLGEAGVIRIGLEVAAPSNRVTPTQWQTATQVIRSLQEMYAIPGEGVVQSDGLALPLLPTAPSPPKRSG